MKNLIIFDIDGTLCNTKQVDEECYEAAFEGATSASISNVDYESFKHMTDQSIWEESNEQLGLKDTGVLGALDNMKETHYALLKEKKSKQPGRFSEIPGAKQFFSDLLKRSDEFQPGFATGAWSFSAKFKLNSIGIDPDLFPFSNSSCYKTRDDIVMDCINKAKNIVPENDFRRIIYLGDGAWDLQTCKNLGLEFIGIDIDRTGRLKELGAQHVFEHFLNSEAIFSLLEGEEVFTGY